VQSASVGGKVAGMLHIFVVLDCCGLGSSSFVAEFYSMFQDIVATLKRLFLMVKAVIPIESTTQSPQLVFNQGIASPFSAYGYSIRFVYESTTATSPYLINDTSEGGV
jgi:hypothetical protein